MFHQTRTLHYQNAALPANYFCKKIDELDKAVRTMQADRLETDLAEVIEGLKAACTFNLLKWDMIITILRISESQCFSMLK